jgi:hypothetical protein
MIAGSTPGWTFHMLLQKELGPLLQSSVITKPSIILNRESEFVPLYGLAMLSVLSLGFLVTSNWSSSISLCYSHSTLASWLQSNLNFCQWFVNCCCATSFETTAVITATCFTAGKF